MQIALLQMMDGLKMVLLLPLLSSVVALDVLHAQLRPLQLQEQSTALQPLQVGHIPLQPRLSHNVLSELVMLLQTRRLLAQPVPLQATADLAMIFLSAQPANQDLSLMQLPELALLLLELNMEAVIKLTELNLLTAKLVSALKTENSKKIPPLLLLPKLR